MRALVVDDRTREKVKAVMDFALNPQHWLRPEGEYRIPGDNPELCVELDTFRCVFTITMTPDGPFRHLSISVPSENYANPLAAYTIAELFGFNGWDGKSFHVPEGWLAKVDKTDHCIVLAQPYEAEP